MEYGDLLMEKIGGRLGKNLVQYFPVTLIHQEVAFYFFFFWLQWRESPVCPLVFMASHGETGGVCLVSAS